MVPWQYTDQFVRLSQAIDIPVCTGEDMYLKESFKPLLEARGVSVIHPDVLTSGGILCDGAKASCATKISVSLDNALLALEMTKRGRLLPEGQGLCGRTADETIRNVARVAREGMKETDDQILETMLYGCAPRPEAAG